MIAPVTKTCSKCAETKPVTAFMAGRHWCRKCWNAYTLEWRKRRRKNIEDGSYRPRPRTQLAEKVCPDCGKLKPRSEYHEDCGTIKRVCKSCHTKIVGRWRERNRDRVNAQAREYRRRKRIIRVLLERAENYEMDLGVEPVDRDEVIQLAVEAYRACNQWIHQAEGRTRSSFTGVTAERFVDALTPDWKERIRLMNHVVRLAKA